MESLKSATIDILMYTKFFFLTWKTFINAEILQIYKLL